MTFSERLVTKVSALLGGRAVGRRSVLAGAAVVGSALVTDPWRYVTRPVSAYATVCGDGARCDEGWSAFCCTVVGANSCPPGSFVAGWWKADRSGFCCGSARYYIDCNASCGSGWRCRCAEGTCDQRRVACNQFRYGQCHQEISCYGPVVCRVITCTPPWQFDPACGTTSLTDNRTATHSAPCLPGTCPSVLTRYHFDHGGPGGPYGKVLSAERALSGGGRYLPLENAILYTLGGSSTVNVLDGSLLSRFRAAGGPHPPMGDPAGAVVRRDTWRGVRTTGGVIYAATATGVHAIHGGFYTVWRQIGGVDSGLGLPTSERVSAGGVSRQSFARGRIYHSAATGTHQVSGPVWDRYVAMGLEKSSLGLPTAHQRIESGKQVGTFVGGLIVWSPATGAWPVRGPILAKWRALDATSGVLGFPTAAQQASSAGRFTQRFARGAMYVVPGRGANHLYGGFYEKWQTLTAAERAQLGFPISGRISVAGGIRMNMQFGGMYSHPNIGVRWVARQIDAAYREEFGWIAGLGFPTRSYRPSGSRFRADFQRGALVYDPATGRVTKL